MRSSERFKASTASKGLDPVTAASLFLTEYSMFPLCTFCLLKSTNSIILNLHYTYVTGSEKRAHLAQEFKIELLVLKGRVALKQ